MLRALSVRQFAIIEHLELDFPSGFTVITGETGAGKSILIDALGQLLGDRADSSLVASGAEQADLTATFELDQGHPAEAWLCSQALNEDGLLLIRRVLPASGSSRAWINGRPATMAQLAELGGLLVEIHGQHQHHELEKPALQRSLLDREVPEPARHLVGRTFSAWQSSVEQLKALDAANADPAQVELMRFQLDELEQLNLQDGEYAQLEKEQERLARSDEIRAAKARALAVLDADDQPGVRGLLQSAQTALEKLGDIDPELAGVAGLLSESAINIDEAISTLERHSDPDDDDPSRLDTVNQRLQRCLDLARKHRIEPEALPTLGNSLRERVERFDNQDDERQRLQRAVEQALASWQTAAHELHEQRARAARDLERRILARLSELGMDKARFAVQVNPVEDPKPSPHGADRIELLFSANPGQTLRPLSRVASGGELSRVSLAMMIAADQDLAPKVRVFDEVDAGIGGETAAVVGQFLSQAAQRGQALCVTHLPQVAAYADHQISVLKTASSNQTGVEVKALSNDERVEEIARMLGSSSSTKSREHAREMLEATRGSE